MIYPRVSGSAGIVPADISKGKSKVNTLFDTVSKPAAVPATAQPKLADRAILIRISCGLPGKVRKNSSLSTQVKQEHALGEEAGDWQTKLWPKWALEPLEKVLNEARQFHAAVTLPFDAGIGILPAPLVLTYGDKMREYKDRFEHLIASHFRPKFPEMVEWAKKAHNGTFDLSQYDDLEAICQCFYFRTEPLPVPDKGHFTDTMTSLLGHDAESVNIRVADAVQEAQRELMRRLIKPVQAMADKLGQAPKEGKESPIFRDTLVGNLKEIAELAPKLNLTGDKVIDAFAKEIEALAKYDPDTLRTSPATRSHVHQKAADLFKRLDGYKI